MATITTEYDVGDVVYHATTTTEVRAHPCPDCHGSRKWKAESPAGGVFEVPCPRCDASYQSNRALDLKYSVWAPYTRRLTIGSVRVNESPEYMCVETGVGSGSVYREKDLFRTEAEALAAATTKANLANADTAGWVAKQYDETARFCDYQLRDASIRAAEDGASRAFYRIRRLMEDLDDAETIEEVKERMATFREADQ